MFLRIISFVFLFLVRLRFPSNLSIIQVLRNRYGDDVVKLVRNFEKLDFKYRKVLLDLDFLDTCVKNNVTPNFVQFRVANKDLRNSATYKRCQSKLLKEEINNKKRRLKVLKNDLTSVKEELFLKMKWIDFNHVCNIFLVGNDRAILKHQKIQNKKYNNLP